MHKKVLILGFSVVLLAVMCFTVSVANCDPPHKGDLMPPFKLPVPKNKVYREYLGIGDNSTEFTVSDIKADVVIVEIFSMYCPHCQRSAPDVNKLYEAIEKDPKLKNRVKVLGIGIGNTSYEIEFFRKKYSIPFPLIPDGEFVLYKKIGVKRTPYFIGVKLAEDKKARVFYSKPGGFDDYRKFLDDMIRLSGLKCSK